MIYYSPYWLFTWDFLSLLKHCSNQVVGNAWFLRFHEKFYVKVLNPLIDNVQKSSDTLLNVISDTKWFLTLFFLTFHFEPPENIRKTKVFWCFQGDQNGTLGRKGLTKVCYGNKHFWFISFTKTNKKTDRDIKKYCKNICK